MHSERPNRNSSRVFPSKPCRQGNYYILWFLWHISLQRLKMYCFEEVFFSRLSGTWGLPNVVTSSYPSRREIGLTETTYPCHYNCHLHIERLPDEELIIARPIEETRQPSLVPNPAANTRAEQKQWWDGWISKYIPQLVTSIGCDWVKPSLNIIMCIVCAHPKLSVWDVRLKLEVISTSWPVSPPDPLYDAQLVHPAARDIKFQLSVTESLTCTLY